MSSERSKPDNIVAARPSVSRPDALGPAALADARRHEPLRGLAGLGFVIPVTALLSVGAGGAVHTLTVLAPVITFALPIIAMIAFWWEDWPGILLPRPWSGLYDTAVVVAGGVVLTLLGQLLAHGRPPLPLAGGIFTIMLQLTLVCERWPVGGLGRLRSGIAAVALCWALGLTAWLVLVRSGAVDAEDYGAWLTSIGAWQMLCYVALRGWPFARIDRRSVRLPLANATVLACGWGSYLLADDVLGWPGTRIAAVAGAMIGSILVVSMLFEAWPAIRFARARGRAVAVALAIVLTASLVWLLPMLAHVLGVPRARAWSWTTQVTLNALSTAVILHVAVWRRWPVRATDTAARTHSLPTRMVR